MIIPQQLLWNFLWSSTDDRCDRTFPTGKRFEHEWEKAMLEEESNPSEQDWDASMEEWVPSFRDGILHKVPWDVTTQRQGPKSRSPEERALLDDKVAWAELSTPLPYDRFKRDVYNLAKYVLESGQWEIKSSEWQMGHMEDSQVSLVNSLLLVTTKPWTKH
jgi:hypothetical protein